MRTAARVTVGVSLAIIYGGVIPGCSIRVAGSAAKPTALERQLLGEYEELDEDLLHASSVRGEAEGEATPSYDTLRAEALEQRSVQRFNEDDLLELKAAHCLAEALDATVVVRPCSLADGDAAAGRRRARVAAEENRARSVILTWAAYQLARNQGRLAPAATELNEVRKAYRQLLLEAAAPGQLVETSPGNFREAAR